MEWSKDCTWTTVSAKGAGFLNCPALCLFNCSMCNSLEVYVGNSTGMNVPITVLNVPIHSRSFHLEGIVLLVAFLASVHGPAACSGWRAQAVSS